MIRSDERLQDPAERGPGFSDTQESPAQAASERLAERARLAGETTIAALPRVTTQSRNSKATARMATAGTYSGTPVVVDDPEPHEATGFGD